MGDDSPEHLDGQSTLEEDFLSAVGQMEHALNQAIENLELGLSMPPMRQEPTPTGPATQVNITNIVSNVNVLDFFEEIAEKLAAADPKEGGKFRRLLKEWSKNPAVLEVLRATLETLARGHGR